MCVIGYMESGVYLSECMLCLSWGLLLENDIVIYLDPLKILTFHFV